MYSVVVYIVVVGSYVLNMHVLMGIGELVLELVVHTSERESEIEKQRDVYTSRVA